MTHLAKGRKLAVLALTAGLAGLSTGLSGAGRAEPDGVALLGAGRHPGPEVPVSVPLRLIEGHPYVEAQIGDRLATMLLDTGAPTAISAALAAGLATRTRGAVATRSAAGAVRDLPVVRIPRLRLGTATFEDVGAVVASIDLGGVAGRSDGIVGANLMAGGVWQIDYSVPELRFARDIAAFAGLADALAFDFAPASRSSPSPVITLEVAGTRLGLLIDTGSSGPLLAHPADLGRSRRVVKLGPFGRTVIASDAIAPGQALAGNDFLDDFVVTIDWPHRRLYLQRRPDPASAATAARVGSERGRDQLAAGD